MSLNEGNCECLIALPSGKNASKCMNEILQDLRRYINFKEALE